MLELASLAQGSTAPNPMVGSVLVCEDKLICQGFHKGPGQWHAEREALLSTRETSFQKCHFICQFRTLLRSWENTALHRYHY